MPLLTKFLSIFRADKSRSAGEHKDMPCLGEKNKQYSCKVLLLDDTELNFDFKPAVKGHTVLSKVYEHLNLIEKDYFGCRYLDSSGQTQWLNPGKTLSSQMKNGVPFILYFGVKFYAADPCKLHEEITRYQFFLQVKRDILQGRLPIAFDVSAELCAYAVQSELGDYDPKRHSQGYVSEFQFLPNQSVELEERITQLHKALIGQVPAVAEYMFLDKVKWLDMYGVDLHPVLGEGNMEYFLGLTPTGVVVYRNKNKVGNYFWPRITKINFKAKMFMIRVRDKNNEESTYAFELASKAPCKHLWKCCVEHHAFFRLSQVQENLGGAGKLFSLGSKYRYSGRTEKQAQNAVKERPQPQVMRTPSRRQERRLNAEYVNKNDINVSKTVVNRHDYPDGSVTHVVTPKHIVSQSRYSNHNSYTPDSPRSTRSAPWETSHMTKAGLYTSGRDSPQSTRSEKMMFPRRGQSGSESEGDYKHRRRHHRGRSRDSEDNESELSGMARKYKRRPKPESGSESEASHRQRHRHRRSGHEEAQWKAVQRRMLGESGRNDDMHRSNGSVHSAPGSETSTNRRRRRHRSRSPSKRPPEEMRKHFEYNLVDPTGLSHEQLMDIPFVQVETVAEPYKIKQSPHNSRHRHKSPRRRSQGTEDMDHSSKPYGYAENEGNYSYDTGNYTSMNNTYNRRSQPNMQYADNVYSRHAQHSGRHEEVLIQAPQTIRKPELHTAPIVKTKPVAVFTALAPNNLPHPYPIMPLEDLANIKGSTEKLSAFKSVGQHSRQDSGLGIDQEYSPSNTRTYDQVNKIKMQDKWNIDTVQGRLNETASKTKQWNSAEGAVCSHSNTSQIDSIQNSALNRNDPVPKPSYRVITRPCYLEQVSTVPSEIGTPPQNRKSQQTHQSPTTRSHQTHHVQSPIRSHQTHSQQISPSKSLDRRIQRTRQTTTPLQSPSKTSNETQQRHEDLRVDINPFNSNGSREFSTIRSSDVLNCSVNTEVLNQVLNSPGKNKDMCTEL